MSKEARSFYQSVVRVTRRFKGPSVHCPAHSAFKVGRAHPLLIAFLFVFGFFSLQSGLHAAVYKTANFIVDASTPAFAQLVAETAERFRSELAVAWLGQELPKWSKACDVKVTTAPDLAAGGETVFTFSNGEVYDWKMTLQGSEERVLDSVLPHEITHTILASYLRAPAPRWLDEGMATSVESDVERMRYRTMLVDFLHTKRGIPFNDMISMKEYPKDLTPFYSQSFSVCEYLILVGGRRRLIEFAKAGYDSNNWDAALKKYYNCESLGDLQAEWVEWVRKWDVANKPAQLPDTRKMPEFNPYQDRETMLAHNERLSAPQVPTRNDYQLANNQTAPYRPGARIWDNVRGGFGLMRQDDPQNADRLARAQNNDNPAEPRSPFNSWPGKFGLSGGNSARGPVGPSPVEPRATLDEEPYRPQVVSTINGSNVTGEWQGAGRQQQAQAASPQSLEGSGWTNPLADGAGTARRSNAAKSSGSANGAAPIYYRPSQVSAPNR